jgi:hypothetical protein
MIQITTGVMFLMSSLYGAGAEGTSLTATAANAAAETPTEVSSNTENKSGNSVEAYIRNEFAGTPILIEIARCESNFRQFDENGKVIQGRVNKEDIGVMQINKKYHGETSEDRNLDIYTTEGNVAYAKYLYEKYGAQPWVHSSKCWATPKEIAQK